MAIDIGNQTVTLLYHNRADSRVVNRRFQGIRLTGIYSGGYLTVVDDTHARLSVLSCEISDGTYQVKVSTGTTVTVTVAQATPYIVLRWVYTGSETADYMSFLAVASPSENDLVVAECTFTGGGNLQGFDYSERSTPNTSDLFLKVEPTEDTELRVRVRAGRVQNGKETFQIPDQKTGLFTPPSSNSRVYLVYVDRASGVIAIDSSGTAAASPVAPNYAGKLVLAEITLATGATDIVAANITEVRDFTNMSYDVDGTTVEIDSNGKLAAKSGVLGQSDVAEATAQAGAPNSYELVPSMVINMTTTGGNVSLDFDTDVSPDSGKTVFFQIWLDGAPVITRIYDHGPFGNNTTLRKTIHMSWLFKSLSAAAHSFAIYWKKDSGGTVVMNSGGTSSRVLRVIELPHSS
jgi:hypothetical protein